MLPLGASTPHFLAVVVSRIHDEACYIHSGDDAWFTSYVLLIRSCYYKKVDKTLDFYFCDTILIVGSSLSLTRRRYMPAFLRRIFDDPGEILIRRGLRLLHCTGVWYALSCVQAARRSYLLTGRFTKVRNPDPYFST
jgi:hypothetical protein